MSMIFAAAERISGSCVKMESSGVCSASTRSDTVPVAQERKQEILPVKPKVEPLRTAVPPHQNAARIVKGVADTRGVGHNVRHIELCVDDREAKAGNEAGRHHLGERIRHDAHTRRCTQA